VSDITWFRQAVLGSIRTRSRFTLPGRKAGITPPQSQVKSTATWVSLAGLADVPDTTNSRPQRSHLQGLEKSVMPPQAWPGSRPGSSRPPHVIPERSAHVILSEAPYVILSEAKDLLSYTRGVAGEAPADIETLFQLPLESFTEARNALAARLKAQGQGGTGSEVKALPKPPASAWAVNQVYWKSRPEYDALLESGARLLDAQRRGAGGEELREAMRERRAALQAAMGRAEDALVSAGHGAGPQVLRRVSATLEALASGAGAERAGALTDDLEPPGFEALAGLAASAPRPKPVALTPSAPRADREEAGALEAAERSRLEAEAARLRRLAQDAATSLAEARERCQGAEREEQEAQRRLDRAHERVLQSESSLREAEARSEQAASEAAAAERALTKPS
jgi:hypothetical protein